MSRFTFLVVAVASIAGSAWGASPAGKYRQEVRNPFRGESYTLVRTLNLNADGTAELYSEYKGDKPSFGQSVRESYGGIIKDVRDHRKVKHSGDWRASGNRIVVELRKLETGNDSHSVNSTFDFERAGDELIARSQDSSDYGTRTMRLQLVEDWSKDDRRDNSDPRKYRGTYGWSESVKGENGESRLIRRLKLDEDRGAELVSEYDGSRPRVDRNATDEFGALFPEVVVNRKITHRGKWREDNGRIRVELNKVGGGKFAQNVASTFVFEPRGEELVLVEGDRSDYGSRSFRLRKNWSSGDSGGRPESKPSYEQPASMELDRTAKGGGMLSHEGSKARSLDQMRLILSQNGKFELRVQGQASEVIRGNYDVKRDNSISLDVTDAFGGSARGAGEAQLDRNGNIGKVTLRGDARGRRFTLTFTAR